MADIDVTYKGSVIRSMSASGQEVLHTAGKLCEDDITIDYTQPGGGGGNLQTKAVTYTPDETGISDTILPDPGYDGMDEVDVTVTAIPDTYVGSAIPQRDSTSLTSTGNVVHVPAGYYASAASRGVANGTAGTPTASKGAVSNHSVDVTPSVTNTTGWIIGSTITGTPVTVSASELVSGSQTVTVNDTYDVTNLAEMVVNVSGGATPVTIAYGSFVGTDGYVVDFNIGEDGPIKNFYCLIEIDPDESEYAYNTNYKVVQSRIFIDNDHPLVYQGHSSDYDYYCADAIPITVDNSGVITSANIWPISEEHQYIRNTTPAAHGALFNQTCPAIRKHTSYVSLYFTTGNGQYKFVSGKTYNWKVVYFGGNYASESVSI